MKRIVIESPYAGNIDRNVAYARACCKDSLLRGESPILSHLLYTQPGILDDDKPEERTLGIAAGLAWVEVADLQAFYVDFGMSRGMIAAFEKAKIEDRFDKCEMRTLEPRVIEKLIATYPDH